jgi:predicted O-methyltransferase YrrM
VEEIRPDRLRTSSGGIVFDLIEDALRDVQHYLDFRASALSRDDYATWMSANGEALVGTLLNEDQRNLSTRFPADARQLVAGVLRDLLQAGIVESVTYPEQDFEGYWRRVTERADHGGRVTYIFPEEARLLYSLAHIIRPKKTVFLGSYYGYWALWAMPGIVAAGGTATLVDIDPAVMAIAERNFTTLGWAHATEFVVADAIDRAGALRDVDLCVLDAEGPKDAPDPDLRDKAIYYPIMRAATPAIRPGGVLVAHNMLLENLTANRYFEDRIDVNRRQFAKFLPHLEEFYDRRCVFPTSEGVGVYRRRDGAAPAARTGAPCAG